MPHRRTISALLLPLTLLQLTGCTHNVWVGPEELYPQGELVQGVQTTSGEQVMFDKPKTVKRGHTMISGRVDQETRRFPIADVESVRVQRGDGAANAGVAVVFVMVVAAVGAFVALASWDGPLRGLGGG